MFSKKDFNYFKQDIEPIIFDTYVQNPTEEGLRNNQYFFQGGLWTNTENLLYFYDRRKLARHKNTLLSICKRLPKFHPVSDQHSGTISSFDLLPLPDIFKSQSLDEMYYQLTIANHFANLVCGADIASIAPVSVGKDKAFLIVIDKKYRSYFEKEGQEPFDD